MTHDKLVGKVVRAMCEAVGAESLDEVDLRAYKAQAIDAIAVVLEEAAKRVREVRNDPLTQMGDRHGKAGDWMRAALDDAESAITAMTGRKC